jgi:hypothetical protein
VPEAKAAKCGSEVDEAAQKHYKRDFSGKCEDESDQGGRKHKKNYGQQRQAQEKYFRP